MTDESNGNASPEPVAEEQVNGGGAGDETQNDIPCGDTGMVEEELIVLDETVTALEERLAEAEQQAAEYREGWQRAQASFANYRKRTEAEQAHWRSAANANLLARLLPVLDDFQRAFDALPDEFKGDPWLNGITLIQRKVRAILDSESVIAIELKPGDDFDPLFHQAIVYQEVEGFSDGQVVAEVEKGYILGDRVLRPSMVVVAKTPAGTQLAESENSQPPGEHPAEETGEVVEGEVISMDQEETSPATDGDTDAN